VELRNALTSRFGVELPATATFDYPSLAALAGYIASHIDIPDVGIAEPGLAEQDAEGAATAVDLGSVRWAQWAAVVCCCQTLLHKKHGRVHQCQCQCPVALQDHHTGCSSRCSGCCGCGWQSAIDGGRPRLPGCASNVCISDGTHWQQMCWADQGDNHYTHIGAVELRNALNAAFTIELPATAIMDYPTVEALTGHVAGLVAPSPPGMTGAWRCLSAVTGHTSEVNWTQPQALQLHPHHSSVGVSSLPHDSSLYPRLQSS
jgi:acyl carrier protein